MDKITKAILFGGKAIVSVVDAKELANYALSKHKPGDIAGEALSRMLAMTAFLSAGIKGASINMSISIEGDGAFGKIITAGKTGGKVRGYIENKNAEADSVQAGIGKGSMTVIKDFGLKEPYVGRTELVRGDIDSDFAYYFTVSEQLPSAVASGAIVKDGVCSSCGAIIVQPMPNCEEEIIVILQDIVRNFTHFAEDIARHTPEEIILEHFGHFEHKFLEDITPEYVCVCSKERMDNVVRSIGSRDAEEIIREQGVIEIHCDFCNTYYRYTEEDLKEIFGGRNV